MHGMTVEELRDQLNLLIEDGDGDKKIMFSYNYGDHWHTQVAQGVGSVDASYVKFSDYHRMYKVDEECDNEETAKENGSELVMLIQS